MNDDDSIVLPVKKSSVKYGAAKVSSKHKSHHGYKHSKNKVHNAKNLKDIRVKEVPGWGSKYKIPQISANHRPIEVCD